MQQMYLRLLRKHSLSRCDDLFPQAKVATYVNLALNHQSQIDYAVTSSPLDVIDFAVLDPDLNFSDHGHTHLYLVTG